MTVQLDVPYYQQESGYSCWWFSLRMLLAYHWGHVPAYPWEWQPDVFGASHGAGIADSLRLVDLQYMESTTRVPYDYGPYFTEHPSVWYEHGVLPDLEHVRQLARIAGLEAADLGCENYSTRGAHARTMEPSWLEARLRAVGPLLVIRERGGGHHAMVVSGMVTYGDGTSMVIVEDPWPVEVDAAGRASEGGPGRGITFPAFQDMLAPQLRAYNMLKLAHAGRLHLRLAPT